MTNVFAAAPLVALVACGGELTTSGETMGNAGGGGRSTGMTAAAAGPSTTGTGGVTTGPGGASTGAGTAGGGAGGCGVVVDPPFIPCMTSADCEDDGGGDFVCTVANRCGRISGSCANEADCLCGTRCCVGPQCRKDGALEGVCIPPDVPPGPPACDSTSELPDLIVRLSFSVASCRPPFALEATVCNRGHLAANGHLPVAFYDGFEANPSSVLCVAYTDGPLPGGTGCRSVLCVVTSPSMLPATVTAVVNDDGVGGRPEIECRYDDNAYTAHLYCEGPQ